MAQIPLVNTSGKKVKSLKVSGKIFGAKVNPSLVNQAVRVYLSNQRQASARTKSRGEVKVPKAKIWRQKGTGRARHGSRNAPIFVGGAKAHGPTGQQNFNLKLTRKMKRLSLFSALTQKLKDQEVIAVSGLDTQKPKTKIFAQIIQKLAPKAKNATLILAPKPPANIVTATKNLPRLSVTSADKLTTYQALSSHQLIFTEKSLKSLTDHYAG